MALVLKSDAFVDGGSIPLRYTCEGEDCSPPLRWENLPEGTRSLVLIVDDPDAPDPAAPRMVWDHWILYNIPPECGGLPEDAARTGLPAGTREGINSWGRTGYGGPCPPIGRHRYFHRLYALDVCLADLGTPRKDDLLLAMDDHILGHAELVGTYQKSATG
ncbi:YbhB/YbcL family Raf kinase inhibitor-like protein [Thermochromatium tepidum]|jgi:phospholipid-binding protein, PBP family|uniref:YbhB/YbcL family Raf kinase inhibitor-like protein n=1 Tax=Thermochromatium tepidum ATCC 43061 TaxID=316276 RepID=A0A6I6DX76_THETI|nr:YbhB/YbcL family Raf kinase inhibitor-like protein [Thermochromatium tepidum]QGU32144.1 YbhB/YbcL family Raf kinase inhibitor-like protein [Thermochromatium tepidum ATCC 43061]